MNDIFEAVYYRAANVPNETWQWFNGLSREEWLVVLTITFACGFVSILGFHARRL